MPLATICRYDDTFIRLITLSIIVKSTTPMPTPTVLPMPPLMLVPPMQAAATASSSSPVPPVAAAPPRRAVSTTPPMPYISPSTRYAWNMRRSVRTPASRAASMFPPIRKMCRP
ncbi:MAG: hypothetical protein BWY81_00622 [Firmicutes bacterium ADurb.Bin467]|nr:MAG: hypothetical protein BWY81_00622 [Firmicutes bacterium ADurb.Bin467]